MFKTVERPVFSAVQSGLFPTYFGLQTAIPVVLALTFPGNTLLGVSTGVSGLLDESHRLGSLLPITTAFLSGFVNFVVLLPTVNKVMKQRQGQGMLPSTLIFVLAQDQKILTEFNSQA
jgi:hypothetical protein